MHCINLFYIFQVEPANEPQEREKQTPGSKRHRPITFGNGEQKSPEKRSRSGDRNLKMYTPPSGKYSSRLNNSRPNSGRFSGSNSGRGRGYGRRDYWNSGAPFKRRY